MFIIVEYSGRELRKIINILLKSSLATEIKKMNYIQSFSLIDKKIIKSEQKILRIQTSDKEKLLSFLSKHLPQAQEFPL